MVTNGPPMGLAAALALIALLLVVLVGALVMAHAHMLVTGRTPFFMRSPVGEVTMWILFKGGYVLRKCGLKKLLEKGMRAKGLEKAMQLSNTVQVNDHQKRICFIGSSTFTFWTHIEKDFRGLGPDVKVFNAGFGGSTTEDILPLVDQLCTQFEPSAVVYFCGTNNLSFGLDDASVIHGFLSFLQLLWAKCPTTHVMFLSITVTPFYRNWNLNNCVYRAQKLNTDISRRIAEHPSKELLSFVDTSSCSWASNTKYYLGDLHHLNDEGHALLGVEVMNHLQRHCSQLLTKLPPVQ
jgi:hypothetical protein